MSKMLRNLIRDDTGAVTVDWVVITAAVAGLGALIILNIQEGATDTATGIGNFISERRDVLD